jgi:hypothetical protein
VNEEHYIALEFDVRVHTKGLKRSVSIENFTCYDSWPTYTAVKFKTFVDTWFDKLHRFLHHFFLLEEIKVKIENRPLYAYRRDFTQKNHSITNGNVLCGPYVFLNLLRSITNKVDLTAIKMQTYAEKIYNFRHAGGLYAFSLDFVNRVDAGQVNFLDSMMLENYAWDSEPRKYSPSRKRIVIDVD